MNKYPSQALKAIVILLMFFSNENTAQTVVLVNGVPTKVILNGEEIKNIVQKKVADYMSDYGLEPNDVFTKSAINVKPEESTKELEVVMPKVALVEQKEIVAIDDKK